ncbi:MAG: DNA methyltransferase [Armatimonadota bacterium]
MSDMELDLQLDDPASFPVDEERAQVREKYRQRLAEKLKDPEFRKIEGFPIGTDEAILALSDPPYYTACPNPFINEWLHAISKKYDHETDDYQCEPFASDVSEGKNDPIYNAHSYHTKVPHKAIMRYILHYTNPGDVVYDGFCGTGMAGVAAQMCGNRQQVESLGYRIQSDGTILDENGKAFSKIGTRNAILNDLSPAATFIAYNYNSSVDSLSFKRDAKRILAQVEIECGWMYFTLHEPFEDEISCIATAIRSSNSSSDIKDIYTNHPKIGRVNYTIWSDVFICPNCGEDIIFWNVAVNIDEGTVAETFRCQHCGAETSKRNCDRAFITVFDDAIQQTVRHGKQVPVLISYKVGKKRYEKKPDAADLALISFIDSNKVPYWYPTELILGKGEKWGDTWRAGYCEGITRAHDFYTSRTLHILSAFASRAGFGPLRWLLTAVAEGSSKMNRERPGGLPSKLSGTIYFSSLFREISAIDFLMRKVDKHPCFNGFNNAYVSVASASELLFSESSVDYIFTDPPFGQNLQYSELNFLWESWLRVRTQNHDEAVISSSQNKKLAEYQQIMTRCFQQYYRALKPGRWMTVEFHNSANTVWNAIQEALERAGFVVADVRVIDKQQGSFNQVSTASATKVDLIISCYKPRSEFEKRFELAKGQIEGVVEFLRQHLAMLPVAPITNDSKIEVVAERTRYLLFDRMVSYHLQHGARIPISAAEFYQMLNEQFVERDDMYFLPDQAARYDALRARTDVKQLSIFIRDERSAVQWVRSQLLQQTQTLGNLTPKFMQETRDWEVQEARPELRDILKENFIQDENELWRVPDPNQEKDLEALRRKGLLRTFDGYTKSKGQLKVFRKEAILEGFKHCWQTKQFGVIVAVCENIPPKILQEIPEFVQFYDIAKDLAPAETVQLEFTWEG